MKLNVHFQFFLDDFYGADKYFETEKATIEKCISRWSNVKGCSGLLYKIRQVVLGIFGRSDWQAAKNAIKKCQVHGFIEFARIMNAPSSIIKENMRGIGKNNGALLEIFLEFNKRNVSSEEPIGNNPGYIAFLERIEFWRNIPADDV